MGTLWVKILDFNLRKRGGVITGYNWGQQEN